jgi:hypothetical protein
MRPHIIALIALAATPLAPVGAQDNQRQFAVEGAGMLTCARFTDARADTASPEYQRMIGFIEGYLTAANLYEPDTFDLTPWHNAAALDMIVGNHCEQFPDDRLVGVTQRMVGGLRPFRVARFSPLLEVGDGENRAFVYEKILRRAQAAEARAASIESAVAAAPELRVEHRPMKPESDAEILRKLAMGEIRSHNFEQRVLNTTDDNELVPTEFLARVQELMLYTGPMLNESYFTRINTSNGRDIRVPVEATRPTGTAVAESAVYAESEGTFNELTLRAWKYGTLIRVSRELLDDSAIDLVSFLGRQIGVSLGTAVNSALTLGTGTVQPQGIAGAAGSGVTGGTGVAGVPTFPNLIDLVHSVDTAWASRPSVAFMARRATLGIGARHVVVEHATPERRHGASPWIHGGLESNSVRQGWRLALVHDPGTVWR